MVLALLATTIFNLDVTLCYVMAHSVI